MRAISSRRHLGVPCRSVCAEPGTKLSALWHPSQWAWGQALLSSRLTDRTEFWRVTPVGEWQGWGLNSTLTSKPKATATHRLPAFQSLFGLSKEGGGPPSVSLFAIVLYRPSMATDKVLGSRQGLPTAFVTNSLWDVTELWAGGLRSQNGNRDGCPLALCGF